ncbi:MAG TPA: hypothetical protein VGF89_03380 [Steroidobacteraceae bacterium]|jgi:hypothetical protein
MTRCRAEFWLLWLLPLLVMRLLLPTGVMPARGDHGFALILCSVEHPHAAPDSGRAHADAPCPFAAAATLAPPASVALTPCVLWSGSELVLAPAPCSASSVLTRSQQARAPPSFS